MKRTDILATIQAASAQQKLVTLASILWTLGIVDNRANLSALRGHLSALRTARAIETHLIGNDIAYSAK